MVSLMMFTFIALAIAAASVILMIGGLRMAALDTFEMLTKAASQARANGEIVPKLAFAVLWIMIFALSYF